MSEIAHVTRDFIYADAPDSEVPPIGYKHPVQMDWSVIEPIAGGRIIDVIPHDTIGILFDLESGPGGTDTIWQMNFTLDGDNWSPFLFGVQQLRNMNFNSLYFFSVTQFLAVEPRIVSWDPANPGDIIDVWVILE